MTLWVIGGLDPTRGAGVLRDVLTASRVEPSIPTHTVVTALTRQGTGAPAEVRPVADDDLAYQLQASPPPAAIKIGLVPDEHADRIRDFVVHVGVPTVVDPVLRASDGGALGSTVAGLLPLLRVATLVTPNADEGRSLSAPLELKLDSIVARLGPTVAVLLKGGPFSTPESVEDLLWDGQTRHRWSHARQAHDPRGTGCALATAIAARLTRSREIAPAVEASIRWLESARGRAMACGDQLLLS